MPIRRAMGARPGHIFTLLVAESALLGFLGAAIGAVIVNGALAAIGPFLASRYGVSLIGAGPGILDLITISAVTLAALVIGTLPAWLAFRRSLSDGLSMKL